MGMEKKCEFCGGPLYPVPSRVERTKFCSQSCRSKGRWARGEYGMERIAAMQAARMPGHNPPKAPRVCEVCGSQYQPNGNKQRWCQVCVPDKGARKRMQLYRVPAPQWEAMVAEQGGLCYLCQAQPATMMDHCHTSGRPRRPLCNACNIALSFFERPGWKERAEAYVTVFQ